MFDENLWLTGIHYKIIPLGYYGEEYAFLFVLGLEPCGGRSEDTSREFNLGTPH